MGMLRNYRKKRAGVRAHAAALKATAKTEAKLAAKEARSLAREAHALDMAEVKERAKQAKRTATEQAKQAKKSASAQAKQAKKSASKQTAQAKKSATQQAKRLDKAARREAAGAKRVAERTLATEKKNRKKNAKAQSAERKQDAKLQAAGRKHEYKMAEMELKKVDAGKFGEKDVKRFLGAAKAATPILIPLVYKVLSSAPAPSLGGSAAEAEEAGIKATGPGAALGGRIVRLEQAVDQLESSRKDSSTKEFVASTRTRLTDLRTSVEAAEVMPTAQRREVHSAISGEIDRVNRDVLARLGVKA